MADSVPCWGLSPGRSLLSSDGSVTASNILLAGSVDLRYVLMTIVDAEMRLRADAASLPARPVPKLVFFLAESHLEVVARQLLLLAISLDTTEELSLQERTDLFVELFGNALVRPQTEVYLHKTSKRLIRMVTDDDYLQECLPMVNLSSLKFKERDFLEAIFKTWQTTSSFDMAVHWENRVRHHLGTRYDSRHGAFDWDYNMKLLDLTSGISWQEFKEWRETGAAFQLRYSSYGASNRSMSSGHCTGKGGDGNAVPGYWGDIVTGPFLAYRSNLGDKPPATQKRTTSMAEEVQKASDDTWKTTFNLIEKLQSMVTRKASSSPVQPQAASNESGSDVDGGTLDSQAASTELDLPTATPSSASPAVDVSIHFLRMDAFQGLERQEKFNNFFNTAYFSNRMVHHLKANVSSIFTADACIYTETVKFVLDLAKEKKEEHTKRVTHLAKLLHFSQQQEAEQDTDGCLLLFKRSGSGS